jgi:hypothetical protein
VVFCGENVVECVVNVVGKTLFFAGLENGTGFLTLFLGWLGLGRGLGVFSDWGILTLIFR